LYGNYSRNDGRRTYANTSSGGQPKRLLPEQLHDVFRIELNRLNNNREIIEPNGLLFDSDIEQNKSSSADDVTQKNTNKYTLQSVYIGEIWRFRVKISNKLNENLINFGLLCHIELNMKGNGQPTQLYPRPSEVCPPQMRRNDNVAIDLEYPVTSNEPAAYSLIFTITCSTEDDVHQLYKDIFEFHAVPCTSLSYQKQTLDENLFVEALVHNVSNQPKLPLYVEVNFKCMGLFKSYNLTHHNKEFAVEDHHTDDDTIYLEPGTEKNVLFQISMKNPTSLVNLNALSVGQIEIKWKSFDATKSTNTFREGIFVSDIIQRRSLFCRKLPNADLSSSSPAISKSKSQSDNIEILVLKCPSSSVVHKPFTVTFHIFNLDRFAQRVWLSIDRNRSGYLLPCNISRRNLGVLETSSSMKTDMTLIGFAAGIHVLTGIVIETQRASGSDNVERKMMHYESSQYIYIDIDEQFHRQKLKEKAERELVLRREMEKHKNLNLEEVEVDQKERETAPRDLKQDEGGGGAVEEKEGDVVNAGGGGDGADRVDGIDGVGDGDDHDDHDDPDGDREEIEHPQIEQEEEPGNGMGMQMDAEYENGGDAVEEAQGMDPQPEVVMEFDDAQDAVEEDGVDGDIGGDQYVDNGDPAQTVEEEVMKEIQTQMKHRSSFELESNTLNTESTVAAADGDGNGMNDGQVEEEEYPLNPSPENKPTLPDESDLIPIGHIKTEEEIQAEIEEEEKQERASLNPLGSPKLSEGKEQQIADEAMTESALQNDTLSEEVPADDLDVSALEITDHDESTTGTIPNEANLYE